MIAKSLFILVCLGCAMRLHSAPQIEQNPIVEIQILSPDSKLISKTEDKKIINLTLNAIKRATDAGSNTYGLSMDHYLVLVAADSKATRWFLDMNSGNFALETKPKLLIYKFKKADFDKILEKLKAEPIRSVTPLAKQIPGETPVPPGEQRSK